MSKIIAKLRRDMFDWYDGVLSQILADLIQSLPQLQQGSRGMISFKGKHFKKTMILIRVALIMRH